MVDGTDRLGPHRCLCLMMILCWWTFDRWNEEDIDRERDLVFSYKKEHLFVSLILSTSRVHSQEYEKLIVCGSDIATINRSAIDANGTIDHFRDGTVTIHMSPLKIDSEDLNDIYDREKMIISLDNEKEWPLLEKKIAGLPKNCPRKWSIKIKSHSVVGGDWDRKGGYVSVQTIIRWAIVR